jgi:predicted DNA-binding transcriptional regulator YafY
MAEADSTALPTPIPTSLNISELARSHGVSRRTIARRLAQGMGAPCAQGSIIATDSAHPCVFTAVDRSIDYSPTTSVADG